MELVTYTYQDGSNTVSEVKRMATVWAFMLAAIVFAIQATFNYTKLLAVVKYGDYNQIPFLLHQMLGFTLASIGLFMQASLNYFEITKRLYPPISTVFGMFSAILAVVGGMIILISILKR